MGFRIFEILDSTILSEIGLHEAGGSPLGFTVVGNIAYVASQNRGIQIIDVQIVEVEPESSTTGTSITGERSVEIKVDLALICMIMFVLYLGRKRY